MVIGNASVCVLERGKVACRVDGTEGLPPVSLPAPARHLAGSQTRTCSILESGNVVCWSEQEQGAPRAVEGIGDVVDIAVGLAHVCALRRAGDVWCWGSNEAGLLGDGSTTPRERPAPVAQLDDVVRIDSKNLHTCALKAGGTVHCWGLGDDGQLGDGKKRGVDEYAAVPVAVANVAGATAISLGDAHGCALARGRVICWGENGVGQLGTGTTEEELAPVEVAGLTDIVEIAAGGGHQCAMRGDGSVLCWGTNTFGQTGQAPIGKTTLRPATVPFPP
jgi:alpha-tubulin suppressor-like RCC1 family protein